MQQAATCPTPTRRYRLLTSVRARGTAAAIIRDAASNAMFKAHLTTYRLDTSVRARGTAAAIISDAASNALFDAHATKYSPLTSVSALRKAAAIIAMQPATPRPTPM